MSTINASSPLSSHPQSTYRLVLMRHGESQWNQENRFTGWADVDLTERGRQEAWSAGQLLRDLGLHFDLAYTSVLKRAIRTLWIALDAMDQMYLPVSQHWRLNERHYGALQGLNKAETAAQYGEQQVLIWRRAYAVAPAPITVEDPRFPGHDRRYAQLQANQLPVTECLRDTVQRVIPIWEENIAPAIREGRQILIAAHGNSLRALMKHIHHISDEDILNLNIPTAQPLMIEFDADLKPLGYRYLGDTEAIAQAMAQVAAQGKAKA